jgi:thiamine pyrophosphate-dependent acetolactate synthase large subunit-like protein
MIHAGSGIIHCNAYDALRRVADAAACAGDDELGGARHAGGDSPLAITMPHVKLNHKVRNDADVVLILGSRIGETDWWGKPPYWRHPSEQKTIQVDIDADIIGLNKPADLGVVADAGRFLELLGDELEARKAEIKLDARRSASPATPGPCRKTAPAGTRRWPTWRCRCIRRTSARPARNCFRPIRCWSPTAATPPSGPCSTTASRCPTR